MCSKFHFKRSLATLILLFLVVSFFGAGDMLLCFGKDGHVAIEFADACNGKVYESHIAGMDNDACGPCTDIQFQSNPAYTRNTSLKMQTLSLISLSNVLSAFSQEDYASDRLLLPISSHNKALASLHSVILII